MTSRRDPLAEELLYLSSLISFRTVLQQNETDCRLVRNNPAERIIYVLDANILHLCFNPMENTNLVRAFPFVEESPEVDRGIAIITANFLLRGELPGRNNFPVYVSAGHWEEFRGRIRETIEDYNRARHKMDPALEARIQDELRACRDALSAAAGDKKALQDITRKRLRPLLLSEECEVVAKRYVLENLLRGGKYVRQLHDAPFLRADTLAKTQPERVSAWQERIADAYANPEQVKKRSDNIARDAACMAQIEAMNIQFRADHITAKAVLITADRAIQLAAQRHYVRMEGHFTRRVTQYLPLINMRDMANSVDDHAATSELKVAISALLEEPQGNQEMTEDTLNELDAGIQNYLHVLRRLALLRVPDTEMQRKKLVVERRLKAQIEKKYGPMMREGRLEAVKSDVILLWEDLLQNSLLANRGLIEGYYEAWWSQFVESVEALSFAQSRALSQGYEREQIDLSHDLARVHFEQIVISDIRSARGHAERWAGICMGTTLDTSYAKHAGRALRKISTGQWFEAEKAITNLCQLDEGESADIALGCATVALQSGRWSTALELARHAVSLLSSEDRPHSALRLTRPRAIFIEVLSRRAILLERAPSGEHVGIRDEVQTCIALAKEAEQEFRTCGAFSETAAALAERASLRASLLMHLLARPSQVGPPAELMAELMEIAVEASGVYDNLTEKCVKDFAGRDLLPVLRCRAAAAVISALICADHYAIRPPRALSGLREEALATLDAFAPEKGPGSIWGALAEAARCRGLAAATGQSPADRARTLSKDLDALAMARAPRFQLELEFIRAAIAQDTDAAPA